MAFVEDFAVFFQDFGVTATPNTGSPVTVIFDRQHIAAMGGDISGTQPVALAVSADVASWVPQQARVAIDGAPGQFLLLDKQPDGTGMTLLLLQEAA